MPCIFCFATLALVAGTVTNAVLDRLEARLAKLPQTAVERVSDTESTTLFQLQVDRDGVPVAITVYKAQRRVRIQVQTHDVSAHEARRIEALIAQALDAQIVERVAAPPGHQHAQNHGEVPFDRSLRHVLTSDSRSRTGRAGPR